MVSKKNESDLSHVGLIPDGNRRFAKRLMEKPWKGHEWGVERIKRVFEWCRQEGIKTITFYVLSLENMDKRPKYELEFIYNLTRKELKDIITNKDNFVHKNRIKMIFFGNLKRLPKDIQKSIKKASDMTRSYSSYCINFAIAYGGRQELVDACRNIGMKIEKGELKAEEVNESLLRQNLLTNGAKDPELIIRTGGEKRLSNFLLYQSAYSELAFIDSLWPELSKEEFLKIIEDFKKRERRLGK